MATPSVGQRLSYDGAICTVRYVGPVAGTSGGLWLGVEWDDPSRGKHDGVHKGVRYFACQLRQVAGGGGGAAATASYTAASTAASFVRPTRPADRTRSFLEAVRDKYASTEAPSTTTYRFSGKVAEEVGFEKVRRQMAQLESLRVVILDSMSVDRTGDGAGDQRSILQTCPCIAELDLGRNLFTSIRTVADVCRQLPELRSLRLNNNRFLVDDDSLAGTVDAVRELSVEETLLSWPDISRLAAYFPALVSLKAGANQLSTLPLPVSAPSLPLTLTTLSLEFNGFASLADLASLAALPVLRNLHLKGNSIASVQSATSQNEHASLAFSPSIHYVDLAYNRVASWDFVDALAHVFPGLSSLRLAHNPIYDSPGLQDGATVVDSGPHKSSGTTSATASAEEAYMITVGRLAGLHTLNFSTVTPTDRANAEMFYLSRIARQMASVPEGPAEAAVVARHRRFADLCTLYGEPSVIRRADVNPAFLEARLVTVLFSLAASSLQQQQQQKQMQKQRSVQIPRSFDMYAVKGIVGRLFGTPPQKLRLVWETGEWDPVAGFDGDADGETGEDEMDAEAAELEAERAEAAAETERAETTEKPDTGHHHGNKTGRWVKREVELKDSPRQFGFCVDGVQARIRVEVR